mmetsp:Transcript_15946/g.46150  ORF Transcript_15946/g.46150 Transcript_15946/m.46150 type:complete len:221 (+) Transcript_15946:691-1353(+)
MELQQGHRPRRGCRREQASVRALLRASPAGDPHAAVQKGVPAHRHLDVQPPAGVRPGLPCRGGRCSRLPGGHVDVLAAQQGGHQAGRELSRRGLLLEPYDPLRIRELRRAAKHGRRVRAHPGVPHVAVAGRSAEDQPVGARRGAHLVAAARADAERHVERHADDAASADGGAGGAAAVAPLGGVGGVGAQAVSDELGRLAPAHVLHSAPALVHLQGRLRV